MTTASDIKTALHRHYNGRKANTVQDGEQWVCIEEARSGKGWEGNNGQCDFLAINTWQSRGLDIIGHEIKVSLSDWRAELAAEDKADRFARFCRRWYVVVPTELAAKMDHEVPPTWGLKVCGARGITERQKPQVREPDPVPWSWWVGWLAQIDRQHKRQIPAAVEDRLRPERERMQAFMDDHANRRAAAQDESTLRRLNQLAEFERATGLHLEHMCNWDLERLGRMLNALRNGSDLTGIANQMRKAVETIDAVMATVAALPDAPTGAAA